MMNSFYAVFVLVLVLGLRKGEVFGVWSAVDMQARELTIDQQLQRVRRELLLRETKTAARAGLAPRWSFMGPFETIDLNAPNGIEDYVQRYEPMYQALADQQFETADWAATLKAGLLRQRRDAPHRGSCRAPCMA